jgi:rhamnose utilization protein RhaD (predicted bifunctional aldolase and dehydrogenase)
MLVQGPGGNASIKSSDQKYLYIKASGYRLSEVSADSGYVAVDLKRVSRLMESEDLATASPEVAHVRAAARIRDAVSAGSRLRPSLETPFHAMFDRCVLHTHAVYANAFACMQNGHVELGRILSEPVCFVEYHAPGYALARAIEGATRAYSAAHGRAPGAVLLENHGLITSGPDVAAAVDATMQVVAAGKKHFGDIAEPGVNPGEYEDHAVQRWAEDLAASFQARLGQRAVTKAITTGPLRRAVRNPLVRLVNGHFGPDEAVFFEGNIRVCEQGVAAQMWMDYFEPEVPVRLVAAIADRGVVLLAPNARTIRTMQESLTAHVLVGELIARAGQEQCLAPEDTDYLLSMEDERYRQTLANEQRN